MQTMKDTKIKWLGEIPDSWQLKKIKYVLQERIEKNNPVRTTYILSLTAKQGVIPYDEKEGGGNKPKEDVSAYRLMKLPTAEHFGLTEDKEKRLSEIIDEINSRTGKNYDNDVVVKAMLQIKDILMKSDKLKTSAKNNTQQDFEFSYFDDIDDALIEGLSQNQDFFSMLLSNDEMKRQVLGIFSEEIYKSLRESL